MIDVSSTLNQQNRDALAPHVGAKKCDFDTVSSDAFFDVLAHHASGLVAVLDTSDNVIFMNHGFSHFIDLSSRQSPVEIAADLFPPKVFQRLEHIAKTAEDACNVSIKHHDGSLHEYRIRYVRYCEDTLPGQHKTLIVGEDVTQARLADESFREHKSKLNYQAFHDALTGLANRSLFYDRVGNSLSRAKRGQSTFAVILLDMDDFKQINDRHGRDCGDLLLKKAALRLLDELRDTDTVARLGGDEFAIILEEVRAVNDVASIAQKILASLSQPVTTEGVTVSSTVSMGVSIFPRDGSTTDRLMQRADAAMYCAKSSGKNRINYYTCAMRDNPVSFLLFENDLRQAIESQAMVLHYQPQIDLRDGRIVGVEALVRWNHPERGLLWPNHFIPIAEETGLVESLGAWSLAHACQRFYTWLRQGVNLGKVAVNVSVRQFRQENFHDNIVAILEKCGLPAHYLELEITETAVMEHAQETADVLARLNQLGVALAIDDFGTGYSSLAYLKRFPVHKLKIDRSFIDDIEHGAPEAAIAKSIIDLSHNMSMQVVAEGVERLAQSRWLKDHGCDQVQGFYYCQPMSEAALMRFISDETKVIKDKGCGFRVVL